ncbi:MAG TPA: helix-turn-helix transcriptional regulator [Pseudonocardiaceae bacterium]|jgi:transcriptional regulator with XRE-family HTH domain
MADPRELPATPAAVDGAANPKHELAAELRRLKESSALSFARLGAKTHVSKSSLERYLNGKLMPPKQIVAAISDTCGGDTRRLLTLWDRAAGYRPTEDDPPTTATRHGARLIAIATFSLVVVAGGVLGAVLWSQRTAAQGPAPPVDSTACTYPYVCFFDRGLTGSFRDYSDDFQPLTDSRGAAMMVNSRHDDVVWLRWSDGHVECTLPRATYRLSTEPAVDGIRIARDGNCGPPTGGTRATAVPPR